MSSYEQLEEKRFRELKETRSKLHTVSLVCASCLVAVILLCIATTVYVCGLQ